MMVNDEAKPLSGDLTLSLETKAGKGLARTQQAFTIPELGQQEYRMSLPIPRATGDYVLKVVAQPRNKTAQESTVCRRWVSLTE
jgi:hypothetical protein